MASQKLFKSSVGSPRITALPTLQTELLFDKNHQETAGSAIDEFLLRMEEINKLAPTPQDFNVYQAQLVLLGSIAAVESYIRTVFRHIISVDPIAQACVHLRDISYGAALHLPQSLLPEAILERISFISKRAISDAIRELLAIKGELPDEVDEAIISYVKVCQLRHCAVHRFGKLGAGNAIALGMEEHKDLMEKPLNLTYGALQSCIAISVGLVKVLNNFLFNEILSRVPSSNWTGDFRRDRSRFLTYYSIFSDQVSVFKTPDPISLYRKFYSQLSIWLSENAVVGS